MSDDWHDLWDGDTPPPAERHVECMHCGSAAVYWEKVPCSYSKKGTRWQLNDCTTGKQHECKFNLGRPKQTRFGLLHI